MLFPMLYRLHGLPFLPRHWSSVAKIAILPLLRCIRIIIANRVIFTPFAQLFFSNGFRFKIRTSIQRPPIRNITIRKINPDT